MTTQKNNLCVLTGDYRTVIHGPIRPALKQIETLVKGIPSRFGFLGVLGNHDDCHMVGPLEEMGIRMLINESCDLIIDDEKIQFIGTDDVHYYYTDLALHALEVANRGFSVALIHSPELVDVAAAVGVDLYLCGHTHHGQICLPGGIPILTHLNRGREFYRGQWRVKQMQGITSAGVGTSGIPIRFNTRGELLYVHLHRSQEPHDLENR